MMTECIARTECAERDEARKKASMKRGIMVTACKMSSKQINLKVDELIASWKRKKEIGLDVAELELEMQCWSEIWLSRGNK